MSDNLDKIMTGTNAAIAIIAELPAQYGGTPGKIVGATFQIINNTITFSVKNSDDLTNNQIAYFEKLAVDILAGVAVGAAITIAVPVLGQGAIGVVAAGGIAIISDYASDIVYPIYQNAKETLANSSPQFPPMPPGSIDTRNCHPSSTHNQILNKARSLYQSSEAQGSPLILDLDGDGVETTKLGSSTYFDHDTNGFAEQTAWVGSDDGLLVLDRNGNGIIDNGTELFGNNTILANGQRAANGFAALRDLDSNADGKIDASDAAYSQLKIWKDANNNGITDQGELITLAEAGVASISTTYTNSSTVDANGNAHKQTGSFTRTDGTTASVADVWFTMDAMYSIPKELLAETDEIAGLPDLQGSGVLHSLHQAMLRDTEGAIKQLVEVFAAADGYENGEIRSMG